MTIMFRNSKWDGMSFFIIYDQDYVGWYFRKSLQTVELKTVLEMYDMLADCPDWHLWSKVVSGVWRSLFTCDDVCSDTLEINGLDSCG